MSQSKLAAGAEQRLYGSWTRETIRYGDTDRQGHVNNAVFATLCESGRVHLLLGPGAPALPPQRAFVIARLTLDFLGELTWPGEAEIGTAVLRVGRSSFTLGQAIFKDGLCAATGQSVMVLTDETTRRSTPLPEDYRAWLLTHRVADSHPA